MPKFTEFLLEAQTMNSGAYVFTGPEKFFFDKFCEVMSQSSTVRKIVEDEKTFHHLTQTEKSSVVVLFTQEVLNRHHKVFHSKKLDEIIGERYHWIEEWLSYCGKKARPEVLKELTRRTSQELDILDMQLRSVILFPGTLEISTVRNLVESESPVSLYHFQNALEIGNVSRALDAFKWLQENMSQEDILDSLSSHIFRMYLVSTLVSGGASNSDISDSLRLSYNLVKRLRTSSHRYSQGYLVKAQEKLSKLALSGASLGDLELYVIEFCSHI